MIRELITSRELTCKTVANLLFMRVLCNRELNCQEVKVLHIQFITQKSFFIVSIFFWTTTYKFPFFFLLKYVQNQDTAYSLSNNNYYFKEVIIILKFYLSIIFFYCIFYTFNPPSMSFNLFLVRQKFFSFHNW